MGREEWTIGGGEGPVGGGGGGGEGSTEWVNGH